MKKAYNDHAILTLEDKFIGISLGYDYCAEHEWGINGIKEEFKIKELNKKTMGIESRKITTCPDTLFFKRDGNYALLWFVTSWFNTPEELKDRIPYPFENYKSEINSKIKYHPNDDEKIEPLITAWSENHFGIAVKGKKEVNWLEELYVAFKNKNIAITHLNLSGENPFANASLSIIIPDRLPQNVLDSIYMVDKKKQDLIDYEKNIGMTKLIKNKGNCNGYKGENYFLTCNPRWIDYEDEKNRKKEKKEKKTRYDIMYWVNYPDNNDICGLYTVEEIRKWLKTSGLKLKSLRDRRNG